MPESKLSLQFGHTAFKYGALAILDGTGEFQRSEIVADLRPKQW
jgi:hypothetical protein